MKNKILLTLPILAIVLTGAVLLTQSVKADEPAQHETLIQRLIDRFGLNETEVNEVVDELRKEKQGERREVLEKRLQTAVNEGKITQEQKDSILQKMTEWQSSHDDWADLTPEERKTKMLQHHDEMEQWAEENGVDLEDLMGGFGKGYIRGFGKGYSKGFRQGFFTGNND